MSKEKEETQEVTGLTRIYKALLQYNSDPVSAAGLAGAKYGAAIYESMLRGQTLDGLAEAEQNYMIKVIANIAFPTEDGDLLSNLTILSLLPRGFRASLHDSGRELVHNLFLEGRKIEDQNKSSTTSVGTTSVSSTVSTISTTTTTTTSSTELTKEDEKMKSVTTLSDGVSLDGGLQPVTSTSSVSVAVSDLVVELTDATLTPLGGDLVETSES